MAEFEENIYPNVDEIPYWDDNPQPIQPGHNDTPFGYYDTDPLFRAESVKFSKWAARKLGYPIQDIELVSSSFYTCIEEAVSEYGSIVNSYNMRDNILTLQSSQYGQNTNISQKAVNPNMSKIIEISNQYGMEAGVGGNVGWYSASIITEDGVQVYDLEQAVSRSMVEQGVEDFSVYNNIELKQVFHNAPPAVNRYFNPFIGTGNQYLMTSFGWDKISGVNYIMMPLSNDVMRMQAIEMSDQIRKSAYSFDVVDNKIRIFPIPRATFPIYFKFIFKSDRSAPIVLGNEDGSLWMSDISNIPYGLMTYSNINSPGRQWIMKWGLALSRELLGFIRNKYQTIPSMDSDISLNGNDLIQTAATEKEQLKTEINELLEAVSRKEQMARKQEEATALLEVLNKVPLPIWIA